MVNVLVACVDYPDGEHFPLQYVHVRNKEYINKDIDVSVLNFSKSQEYIYEGINVFSLDYVKNNIYKFKDYVLICHAPNIRCHLKFIKEYGKHFKDIVFFFHGHEIVEQLKVYPKPYNYQKRNVVIRTGLYVYDKLKIIIWRRYFTKVNTTSKLIFVSEFLLKEFKENMKISDSFLNDRIEVINNSVGTVFENRKYNNETIKEFDYITIRSNIDSSVYCVDLVCAIAKNYASKKFLLIGKGDYFNYNDMPPNITHINSTLNQEALLKYIDNSKVALMPTRRDSQGVMSCELATYGILLITSDIPVCKEMFSSFNNVIMMSEEKMMSDLDCINEMCSENIATYNGQFYVENTIDKEINLLKALARRS